MRYRWMKWRLRFAILEVLAVPADPEPIPDCSEHHHAEETTGNANRITSRRDAYATNEKSSKQAEDRSPNGPTCFFWAIACGFHKAVANALS